ncbi:PAS domain S-box protein [Pseudomonas sp. MBLB4136]|uniref:PAS domain S-box protein n=1 Tax=Pseudomonas sp. MBLB4136 TaxID=3451558 RepID=UPI003F75148E
MHTRHVFIQTFLHTLAIALLVLGAGGVLDYVSQQQFNIYSLVLLPDRALPLALLGLGLLAAAQGRFRAVLAASGLVLAFILYSYSHSLLASPTNAPSAALIGQTPLGLVFALAALALPQIIGASRSGRWFGRAAGLLTALLAIAAQLSDLLPDLSELRLGPKPDTNSLYCLLSLALGISLLLLPLLPKERRQLLDRRSLIAGSLGILLTCLMWFLLSAELLRDLHQKSDQALNDLQLSLNHEFEDYGAMLQRFADRWEEPAWSPGTAELNREGRRYLRDFPYLALLGVLDSKLQPHWLFERNLKALNQLTTLLANPEHRAWLHRTRLGVRSAQLVSLGTTVFLASPLQVKGQANSLLIAELQLGSLLNAGTNELSFHVAEHGRAPFLPTPDAAPPTMLGSRIVTLPSGVQWQLQTFLSNPKRSLSLSQLQTLLIVPFGLCISFFLMYSLRLASLAREHNQRLRQTNQALNDSLKRQESLQNLNQRIMQHSTDLLCSHDAQGYFTEVNPAWFPLLGYTREELIGRNYLDLVLPEDRPLSRQHTADSLEDENIHRVRNRYRHKDGHIVYIDWSHSWSTSADSFFCVGHDITHLVQAEAYLEDQRDILGMISTNQPLPEIFDTICRMSESRDPTALCSVQRFDPDSGQLVMNIAPSLPASYLQGTAGVAVGPACGSCGTAMFRKQMVVVEDIASDPLWQDYRELALGHGLRACWSIPLIGDNGQVFGSLALYHRQPMAPDDQHLQLISTAAQLATIACERSADRKSLERSEQRFRSLYDFTPSAVFSINRQGKIESVNDAGCQLFGTQEANLLGTPAATFLQPDDASRVNEHFRTARNGEAQRFEAKFRTPSGLPLELECTYLPIRVDEQIVGVFAVAKDVGARNQLERDLRTALLHSQRRGMLLRGLSDIAVQINGMFDNPKLLDLLCERLRSLIGVHQALFNLCADTVSPAQTILAVSSKYADWADRPIMPGYVIQGRDFIEFAHALKLTSAQLQTDPRWTERPAESLAHPPLHGLLAVSLQSASGQQLGFIQLSDKYHGEFDTDDLAIAEQFAQMAVVALENKRLMGEIIAGEHRLKEQLNFTATITDSIGEGLLAFDARGLLTYANPTAATLLGRTNADLRGQALTNLLPIEPNVLSDASAPSAARHGEFMLPGKGNSAAHMRYDCAPLIDGASITGWVMAFRDISAQALAEKAMRERDQFFHLSPELHCMLDQQGRIIQLNPAFVAMLGYPEESLIGHSCLEVIVTEDRETALQSLRQVTRGEPLQNQEVRVQDLQGERHYLQFSAALGDDQLIYFAGRNINARKAAEKKLKTTLKELERSNSELQEFAFVASHDLQEPLRKIQAFSERLEARAANLEPECLDYLHRMSSAAGRMQALIKDLLSYSRVTSRAQPFVRLDVDSILDEVLQDMEVTLSSAGAQVEREPLPDLVGEPTHIRQLLQNLLSNAAKFHAPGQPPKIRIYSEASDVNEWTLCVEDQGIGFDEKYLDRIFNPFQRLHDRQAYAGTGIGLAIVKKIVEHHRATVTASSKPGRGTTFRITFASTE